jgi:hypothetical protein
MTELSEGAQGVGTASPRQLGASAAAPAPVAGKAPAKVAVIATHGMGQQVPFETIDAITEGLLKAAGPDGLRRPVTARTVRIGDQTLQRAEFEVGNAEGEPVEVHVYEGYWAPLTEGQITLRDVLRFLAAGSLNGIINARGRFWRYLFGEYYDFGPQALRNRGWLSAALAAVVSVLLLTTLATVAPAGALLAQGAAETGAAWKLGPLLALYTDVVAVFVAASLVLLAPLIVLSVLRRRIARPSADRRWTAACRVADGLLRLWILVATVCALAVVFFGAWLLWHPATLPGPWFRLPGWLAFLCWGLLYWVAWKVRRFFVQFLGDVAAYVQPHILDRFLAIRLQIKKWVMDVAGPVYRANDSDGRHEYQGVIMIGHSLGSVLTYDTLNALLNQDALAGNVDGIAARTRALITFGSPLDKTAFVFGHQKEVTSVTREALAASVQPLIQDAKYRAFEWINVYSDRDVISDALLYYDPPAACGSAGGWPVENREDPDALIPLAAHTEYWRNPAVFVALYSKL